VQPEVWQVEAEASRSVTANLSVPKGGSGNSNWCPSEQAAVWFVGHDKRPDVPYCYDPTEPNKHAKFTRSTVAALEISDSFLSPGDAPSEIDRHDCLRFHVDDDSLEDVVCFVGAKNWGSGEAYSELYLQQPDGTLKKADPFESGLNPHPTTRSLLGASLKQAGTDRNLVYVATVGGPRDDGRTNAHRMYVATGSDKAPFFEEVDGPWTATDFDSACAVSADINGGTYNQTR